MSETMALISSRNSRVIIFIAVVALTIFALFHWSNRKNVQRAVVGGIAEQQSGAVISNQPQSGAPCKCSPIPTEEVLHTLSHEALAQIYHNYVNSIQFSCKTAIRHGNIGDGGWDVCVDPPYLPQKPCLVYSFGISNDWSFDDSITSKYGCELHAYDPSMRVKDHDRKPILHFHNTGLHSVDETNKGGWRMRTFGSLLKENGHTQATIDVLKIDIEHSEWDAFPEMLKTGTLNKVKQFCFEIHMKLKHQPEASSEKYIRGLNLFRDLYHAGYRIFKTHKNMDAKYNSKYGMLRTGCHEIYMVKNNTRTYG